MEATIVHWGYIGIMEKKKEATIEPKLAALLPFEVGDFGSRDYLEVLGLSLTMRIHRKGLG